MKIGIPRALLYYYYYPLWREFFTQLGLEVVLSPTTNKGILDAGIKNTLSEVCLPVKVFYGHVSALADKVDYLFVPRINRVEPKAYICPKFMGLPDMLKARLQQMPPFIDTAVDAGMDGNSVQCWVDCFQEVGSKFTHNHQLVNSSIAAAFRTQQEFQRRLTGGMLIPDALENDCVPEVAATSQQNYTLRIGLLGHPYNLYDAYISMNLIHKLQSMGSFVVTPESLSVDEIEDEARKLPKRLFWTLGKRMIGSALNFYASKELDGLIYLTSFGCGPESLVEELVARWAKQQGNLPYLMITIDEHTGEAGMVTRLEAFTEMIKRRQKHENHLSSHGEPLHSG